MRFKKGDRVIIKEKYRFPLQEYKGVVCYCIPKEDLYYGFGTDMYRVLLDYCKDSCLIRGYELTYFGGYSDFLEKIEERMS